jgi:hypothetical protein
MPFNKTTLHGKESETEEEVNREKYQLQAWNASNDVWK